MGNSQSTLVCDGCGLPASPEHLEQRVRRLERSTKYRPIHIGILFVALAPPAREEDDFYGPPKAKDFFEPFLEALEVHPAKASAAAEPAAPDAASETARLVEFQRCGYFLTYLAECPILDVEPVAGTISRLAPTLIRRVRFNYRPKHIALIGNELGSLAEALQSAGIGSLLSAQSGPVLPVPAR